MDDEKRVAMVLLLLLNARPPKVDKRSGKPHCAAWLDAFPQHNDNRQEVKASCCFRDDYVL